MSITVLTVVILMSCKERADETDEEAHKFTGAVPAFHGLSPDGDVSGKIIYVGWGRKGDFDALVRKGEFCSVTVSNWFLIQSPSQVSTSLVQLSSLEMAELSVALRWSLHKSLVLLVCSCMTTLKMTEPSLKQLDTFRTYTLGLLTFVGILIDLVGILTAQQEILPQFRGALCNFYRYIQVMQRHLVTLLIKM
jgi:hypothetical protein